MPTATVSRLIHAPQRDVWSLLADVSQAGRWNKYWTTIEFLSPQTHGAGTRFRARADGRDDAFVFDICEWDAPQKIAFCPVRDPFEQYSIMLDSHVFEVQPVSDEASSVTITAYASASGFKGRILALFFWSGHQKVGLNAALDAIQAIFEPDLFKDEATGPPSQEALPE